MRRALEAARRVVLAASTGLAVVAMVVVGGMMLTITYDVVARFAFRAPTDWAYPLNAVGVLVATTMAIPYLYARREHIAMDLVHRAMPRGLRRASDAVTALAAVLLGGVLVLAGLRSMTVAIEGGLVGSGTFNIPLWIPDAALVLSGGFLILVAVLFPPTAPDGGLAAVPGEPSDTDPAEGESR